MTTALFLIKIGFLPVSIWDVLDVLIVGYLIYQLYKLLRGTIAYNIFIGVFILYVLWWLVRALGMDLLSELLNQFVQVGVLAVIVIFQPEVRRFLLLIGNSTIKQRSNFLRRLVNRPFQKSANDEASVEITALGSTLKRMSRSRTGALIVIANEANADMYKEAGIVVDAKVSQPLLESIFNKQSPLHDGAVIISEGRILAASCILPVSDSAQLPVNAGLRHRAGVGATEASDVAVFIVSEENGNISFAHKGSLEYNINYEELDNLLAKHYI